MFGRWVTSLSSFLLTHNFSFLGVCCLFQKSVWGSADRALGREGKGSTGDSLEVQVHEWHGWTSLWPHQSRASSVSMVVPSKSCVLRGSGDTVCGLCALISGSHGKRYYTTAASVFALAPGARHDPRADVLCRPPMVPWSDKISSFFFCDEWRTACFFPELEVARQSHSAFKFYPRLMYLFIKLYLCGAWDVEALVLGAACGPARTRLTVC